MRRLTASLATSVVCALTFLCTPDDRADAGLVPDVYNFVFGPPGTPYFRTSYYGPAYGYRTSYYGPAYGYRTSYYGPAYGYRVSYRYGVNYPGVYYSSSCCPTRTFYAPWCAPCSPCGVVGCSPCGIDGCPGGICGVSLGTQPTQDGDWNPTPADGGEQPRTFKENGTDEPALPDEGAGRVPGGAAPFDDKEDQTPGFAAPANNNGGGKREALKPEENVPQRQPAPINEPDTDGNGDDVKQPNDDGVKKTPTEEKPAAGNGVLRIPPLDVDQKVTWRVLTSRRRLTIRSRFPTPSLARQRINPNENWFPVLVGTKIVSK